METSPLNSCLAPFTLDSGEIRLTANAPRLRQCRREVTLGLLSEHKHLLIDSAMIVIAAVIRVSIESPMIQLS